MGEGVQFEVLEVEEKSIKLDLNLMMYESGEVMVGVLHYAKELFAAGSMKRLVEQVKTVVEGMVEGVEGKVREISLLSEREREQVMKEWRGEEKRYEEARSVVEWFEGEAEIRKDAVALVYEEEQISYEELNRRSNRLAHHLKN